MTTPPSNAPSPVDATPPEQGVADLAHDFNNLLLALTSCLELIKNRSSEARIGEYAVHGLKALDRGAALVERLVSLTQDRQTSAVAVEPPPSTTDPAPRPPATVLIIDDDDDVRLILAELLESLGYRTIETADGTSGIAALDGNPRPDLAIVDYTLPGRNGGETAGALLARRPDLPILIATGHGSAAALDSRWRHLPILHKPFHIADLSETVAGLLNGARK
jgi:CheY-like chemotaxis protein